MTFPRRTQLFFLVSTCLAASWLKGQEADRVIGSIGDLELRQGEVLASLGRLGTVDKEALAQEPAALKKLVQSILVQKVVLDEALKKQWDQEPSIQPLLKSTREAALTDSYLKSFCQPPDSYPNEAELKTAYEASRAALTVPRSFRLAQIFVGAQKDAEKKLEDVRRRLKADPSSFGKLAREVSEEKESASRDGEIGWLNEKQVQPEIMAKLPQMKVGVVSEPVRLNDGWHLLKVLDVREPFTPLFDQVRVQLAQRLRAEKTRANMQAYMAELLHKHPVAINEVALSKLFPVTSPGDAVRNP